jgi:LemA protein
MSPFFLIIAILLIGSVWMYNTLIAKKNDVAKSFSTIDVMLKKRHDLIPNLIETVKEYMGYEHGLLAEITELRTKAMNTDNVDDERVKTENLLTRKLGTILFSAENYPSLKANTTFLQLQASLNDTEEQLAASRRAYNASVTEYNNAVEMFPANLVASAMNYKTKSLFETAQAEKGNINTGTLLNS